jgi:uncharacterized membrane protein YfcA
MQMLLAAALIFAGAVQGSTGFGFGMLGAPLLAMIDPVLVPAPVLMTGLIITISTSIRERESIDTRGLTISLAGRLVATGLAVAVLSLLDPVTFSYLFAAIILLAVALSASGLRIPHNVGTLFAAGFASGFMGTLTSVGAPPMALAYQDRAGPTTRATLSVFLLVGAMISILALAFAGAIGPEQLAMTAVMAPLAATGFLFSSWTRRLVDRGHLKTIVLVTSAAAAVAMIVNAAT